MREPLQTQCEARPDGAWVFRLSGNLFGSPEGYAFQEEVRQKIAGGPPGIVIDLGGVIRIDSSGVGILVAAMWSASNAGTKLVLATLPKTVEKVLGVAMLLDHIAHAPSVDEALAKLG
jgi:anti-sigma B factor antagonist